MTAVPSGSPAPAAPPPARSARADARPPSETLAERFGRTAAEWLWSPLQGVRLGPWLGLLLRRGSTIAPAYWARAAMTLAFAGPNSALGALDRWRFRRRLADARVRRPVFVIGHYRSGTTHTWNLLTTDPRFAFPSILQATFPHSFLTFEPIVRFPARRLTMKKRPQDAMAMDPDGPIEEEKALCSSTFLSPQMARHFPRAWRDFVRYATMDDVATADRERWKRAFDAFARKLLVRHGPDRTLAFKSGDHTGRIDLVLELFPDARFVHVHRDPFTVFASTRAMERKTGKFFALQRPPSDAELDEFVLTRYRAMMEAYARKVADVPADQLIEVAFTDLERDPVGTVERIYRHLGIAGFDEHRPRLEAYVATLAGYRKNRHPDLAPDVRRRIAEHARVACERWGYSDSPAAESERAPESAS